MDRLEELYNKYLSEILLESKDKLYALPDWKLSSYLSKEELNNRTKDEKIQLIQEKFLINDIVYSLLMSDLNYINTSNFKLTNLKMLSIDDRALEGNGYTEDKKQKVYSFVLKLQKLIKE